MFRKVTVFYQKSMYFISIKNCKDKIKNSQNEQYDMFIFAYN